MVTTRDTAADQMLGDSSLFPRPAPYIVRNGFAFIALLSIVFSIPGIVAGALANLALGYITKLAFGVPLAVPFSVAPLIGLFAALCLPIFIVFHTLSGFIVASVLELHSSDNTDAASLLACSNQHQVWFRHWKRSEEFRKFVLDNGLAEPGSRYAKFSARIPGDTSYATTL